MVRAKGILPLFLIVILTVGCSGGRNPLSPVGDEPGEPREPKAVAHGITGYVDYGQVVIDKKAGTGKVIHPRTASLALNALGLMEPPTYGCFDIDWDTLIIDDLAHYMGVDVILTHPLKWKFFRAFDVRVVVFGPDILNADGYTAFLNPDDFAGVPYGYQDGLLGTPDEVAQFDNGLDLWGYKYFCDGLGLQENLVEFFSDIDNLVDRGTFSPGAENRRHCDLDFGGDPGDFLVFNYAVLASFHAPTGDYPYDINDFPITTSNTAEAFVCSGVVVENTLFYVDDETNGGSASIDLWIGDWQSWYGGNVFDEYEVKIQFADELGTTYFHSSHEPNPLIPPIEIFHFPNITPALTQSGELPFLITATDLTTTFGESWFKGLLPEDNPRYNDFVYTCWKGSVLISDKIIFDPVDITPDYFEPMWPWDVVVQDEIAYIAGYEQGLVSFDVSDPANPKRLGFNSDLKHSQAVWVEGDYALVARGTYGFSVVDISDPSNPIEVGSCTSGKAVDLAVQGDYAYVADNNGRLRIINITDPTSPYKEGDCEFPFGTTDVCVTGDYAYVTTWSDYSSSGGFYVVDINDPAQPHVVNDEIYIERAKGLCIAGNIAYVLSGGDGITIIDLVAPASPVVRSKIEAPTYPDDIMVVDGYAYIAQETTGLVIPDKWGLWVVDVSDPDNPFLVNNYNCLHNAERIFVADGYAYLTYHASGLYCFDVSEPGNAQLVGHFLVPGVVYDAQFLNEDLMVAANSNAGLLAIDISQPDVPFVASFNEVTVYAQGVDVVGDYVYAVGCDSLMIYDYSNPFLPELLSLHESLTIPNWVTTYSGYSYISGSGLEVVDVTDPYNPTTVTFIDTNQTQVLKIFIEDNIAYIPTTQGELLIYDISDPEQPVFLSEYNPISTVYELRVIDGIAYLATSGLEIVDVSDPVAPTKIGDYFAAWDSWALEVEYGHVFLGCFPERMLYIIDVSDSLNPIFVAECEFPNPFIHRIRLRGDIVYIMDFTGGLRVIKLW
jgi:hypothetical protein